MEPFLFRLLLVRHGESDANARGCFVGRTDSALTEKGRAQARALGQWLAPSHIDACWSSPLQRAHDTATAICQHQGLEPVIDARLAEQDYGVWDGLQFFEARDQYPDAFKRWAEGGTAQPPSGGESLESVAERAVHVFNALQATYRDGETILITAHAGILQALICRLLGTPLSNRWPYRLATGSLTELTVFENRVSMTRMSFQPAL